MMKYRVAAGALMVLLTALAGRPEPSAPSVQAEVQAGLSALEHGDFAAAERHLSAALQLDPTQAKVRANLGLAYYADHQYRRAAREFEQALRRDPSLQTAKSFLPLSQAAAGDCRQATAGLERGFASDPDVKLRRVFGLSLARCWMEGGNETRAEPVAQKLLAAYPDDPDVLYLAGQLYGRLSSEINLRLMKVAPNSPRAYQLMAAVAATDGNWRGAIDAERRALQLDPTLPGAHLQIAVLMLMHSPDPNAWREALAELQEELKVNPASAQAHYEIGEAYRKHGQPDAAVAAFRRALELDPNAVPARVGMAKALRQLGRQQEALRALEPARVSAPDDADVHFLLAQLYRDLGRAADAQKETAAFERLQKSPPALPTRDGSQP
jgi:tetratricopeptide (TPR) repeat protein